MFAASEGHTKVVKQLLEAGANTDLHSEVYTNTTVYTVPVTVLAVSVRLHMSAVALLCVCALHMHSSIATSEAPLYILEAPLWCALIRVPLLCMSPVRDML